MMSVCYAQFSSSIALLFILHIMRLIATYKCYHPFCFKMSGSAIFCNSKNINLTRVETFVVFYRNFVKREKEIDVRIVLYK